MGAQVQVGTSLTYTISKRLGKGGFGQVFLGMKAAGGRPTQKPLQVCDTPNMHIAADVALLVLKCEGCATFWKGCISMLVSDIVGGCKV